MTEKTEKTEKVITKEKKKTGRVWDNPDQVGYTGTGKRKTAIAKIWLRKGTGEIFWNRKKFVSTRAAFVNKINAPLRKLKLENRYDIHAFVEGGGISAQVDAICHGVSRALLKVHPDNRAILKPEGFLTRDSREKERKKYFHKRARKSTQFRKR